MQSNPVSHYSHYSQGALPLRNIRMYMELSDNAIATGAQWPPSNFTARDKRIAELTNAYHGLLDQFGTSGETFPVTSNRLQRIIVLLAELLMLSPPVPSVYNDDERFIEDFRSAITDVIINTLTYGTGLFGVSANPVDQKSLSTQANSISSVTSIAPDIWYPGPAIDTLVQFAVSRNSRDNSIDTALVTTMDRETGITELISWAWGGRSFKTVSARAPLPRSYLIPATNPPDTGGWGTSLIPMLLPLVVEIARRLSSNSRILDQHESPSLVVWIDETDLGNLGVEYDPDGAGDTVEGQTNAGMKALSDMRENGVWAVPNAAQKVEYLTWDGKLSSSFEQIEAVLSEMSALTGVSQLLEQAQGVPSGVALKRLLLPLFARTLSLQNNIHLSATRALRVIQQIRGEAPDATIDWPHPFDLLEQSAQVDPATNVDPDGEGEGDSEGRSDGDDGEGIGSGEKGVNNNE